MATTERSIETSSVTRSLVNRVMETRFDDIPADIVEVSRHCLLDWIAVTVAGASEPLVMKLVDEVREQGGNAQASIVGHNLRTSTAQAALVNGAASHALDYDDVHPALTGHPSVPILSALLALTEHRGASGAEFIEAFTAGYETTCRIGALVNPGHYERGFHATATIGCFGAAAACARLMGLDAERTAHALGIAGTQAAGLKSMFGTMCKSLHAGKAAQNGLLAASLAARGFDSRCDVLECAQGFADTQSGDFDPNAALEDPPGGYHMRANLFKYHASCYLTHAAIECTRRLRDEHAIAPESVREVTVTVNPGCDSVCNISEPTTGLEAKFSLRMMTAYALTGVDTAAIDSYHDAQCANPDLVALRDKVTVAYNPSIGRMASEVEIELTDGTRLNAAHDAAIPNDDLPDQRARLEAKFHSLVDVRLGDAAVDILAEVAKLDQLDDLTPLIRQFSARIA